jgi:hypothetical protein
MQQSYNQSLQEFAQQSMQDSAAFSMHFPRFEFSLLPSIVHARPHAGNANCWVLNQKSRKY